MVKIIKLPYDKGTLDLKVKEENLKAVLVPNEIPLSAKTEKEYVLEALEKPINSKRLRELSNGKSRITVVTSDHTRPVPSQITMPILLKEIRQGNPKADITILIGTGLHRVSSEGEILARFGQEIVNNERIVVHDSSKDEDMVDIGPLPSGRICEVNSLVVETDLLVTEGFIEPHFFAGYSGGRKSILPGVSSAKTVNENHSAQAIANPLVKTGVMEGNPIHADMLYAARKVGVDFILNVIENEEKKIIGAVSGELNEAHQEGCRMVSEISGVKKVEADIVVTTNGGYPLDQNLYQVPKSISTAFECVRENGVIVVASACRDGFGGRNFEQLLFKGQPQEILDYLLGLQLDQTISEQWCNQILSNVLLHCRIILISKLDPEAVRRANLIPAKDIDDAMEKAFEIMGEKASVTVIPDGVAVIAI